MPLEFNRFLMAYHVSYLAVEGPYKLDAARFLRWSMYLGRLLEVQSKEGQDRMRLRVEARRLTDDAADAVADLSALDEDGAPTPRKRRKRGEPEILGDTTRLDGAIFTNGQSLLRLLPPDDPRAVYVRAGGKLDREGNPLILGTKPGKLRMPTPATVQPEAPAIPRTVAQWQPHVAYMPLDPTRPAPSTPPPQTSATPIVAPAPTATPTATPTTGGNITSDGSPTTPTAGLSALARTWSSAHGELGNLPPLPDLPGSSSF